MPAWLTAILLPVVLKLIEKSPEIVDAIKKDERNPLTVPEDEAPTQPKDEPSEGE